MSSRPTDITASADSNMGQHPHNRPIVISPAFRFLKRCFDIVFSLIGMVVGSPLFLVVFLAIKLEDGKTAIFRQERLGYGGRPFIMYKFRSMEITAESDDRPTLCSGHKDKRLTRVGALLRKHHLDELPQLWNVIRGDMSLVGYRPERRFFIERIMTINPDYRLLYHMRPGLFSTATLYNGYTDTMEKMLERLNMDLEYLYHHSLWIDMKIIFVTMFSILSGKTF